MNRKIALCIFLIAGFLGGCSSTSLLYNNANWLVREKVDDYFSISSMQERQLDRDIDLFLKWHRYRELPEYVNMISTFKRQIADGLTREEVSLLFDQITAARVRFVEASLHAASQFLASIDNEQIEIFDREFRQKLDEDREQLELSVEQQKEERFRKYLETLEDWFGDFDQEQQNALRLVSDARSSSYAQWLTRREQRHRELIHFLGSKPGAAAIKVYLRRQYVQRIKHKSDSLRKNSRQFWLTAALSIDQIVTPTQRQRAMSRLDSYRKDFDDLSRQKTDVLPVEVER